MLTFQEGGIVIVQTLRSSSIKKLFCLQEMDNPNDTARHINFNVNVRNHHAFGLCHLRLVPKNRKKKWNTLVVLKCLCLRQQKGLNF